MTRLPYLFAAMFVLAPFGALAGDLGADPVPGSVDTEYEHSDKSFAELDLNSDGELEQSEVSQANEGRHLGGVEFQELDNNEDHVVTRGEWNEYLTE